MVAHSELMRRSEVVIEQTRATLIVVDTRTLQPGREPKGMAEQS